VSRRPGRRAGREGGPAPGKLARPVPRRPDGGRSRARPAPARSRAAGRSAPARAVL